MSLRSLEYRTFGNGSGDVLFSVRTCAIFQADELSLAILDFLRERQATDREHLIEALSVDHAADDIESALRELERTGFISASPFEPIDYSAAMPNKDIPLPGISHLVMNVSHACNLHCSYCYAAGGSYNGKSQLMEPDMAVSAVYFLLDNTSDDEVLVTFFGGEPLLNTEAIKAAVLRGRERARELGKKIGYAVTTNGTLYDEEFLSFAISQGVKFTMSMDGQKELHDKHRKFNDGSGSYDVIVSRLPKLLDRTQVPARTTLTKGNQDVVGIMDHLQSLGFNEVGFAPADVTGGDLSLDESEMEEVIEGFKVLSERFLEAASQAKVYGFTNIINLMRLFHEGEARPVPCGAGIKLMGVSASGELYVCHRFTGNEEFQIGSIQDGIDGGRRREILGSAFVMSKPACRSCWARHLCGGGCYYLSHLHHGTIRDPHALTCSFLRKWYEIGIKIYANIAVENPAFLEKCTGVGLNC